MSRAQEEPVLPDSVTGAVPVPRGGDPDPSVRDPRPAGNGAVANPMSPSRAAMLVLGALCLFGLGALAIEFRGQIRVFPDVAVLSLVVCALTLLFGYRVLRRIRPVRPPGTRVSLAAVAWGFTGATGLALLANDALAGVLAKTVGPEVEFRWGAALTGPFNEELLKLVGIVLITLAFTGAVRGPMDGFVIGSLVGLGFQAAENFVYALISVVQTGGVNGLVAAVLSSVLRVVMTGLGTHWALSALTGTAIGLLAVGSWRPTVRRAVTAFLLVVLAIGLHLSFNAPVLTSNAGIVFRVLLNFTVVMVVYFVIRHGYRRRVLAALDVEGEGTGMTRSDARALARRSGRRKALRKLPEADRVRVADEQERLLDLAEDHASRSFEPPPR